MNNILIVDNICVQSKWSTHIDIPDVLIDRVIGFFEGRFNLTLLSGNQSQYFEIVPNVTFLVTIDIKNSCEVIIEPIEDKIIIDKLFLTIADVPPPEKVCDISTIKITHHPEQDVIISFDFTKPLAEIKGVPCPLVEILEPNTTRFLISESSELFQWRNDTHLYCKFTVGERRLRVKLSLGQPWSAWLPFTCISHKKYRHQRR